MPIVDLNDYEHGPWLLFRGWQVAPTDNLTGATATVQWANKKILMRRSAWDRPSARVLRYVMLHEIVHAIHAETTDGRYDCDELQAARRLDRRSAVEAIADGACLMLDTSSVMRAWVRASVIWHGRVGYRYRWADVVHPVTRQTVLRLLDATRPTGALSA